MELYLVLFTMFWQSLQRQEVNNRLKIPTIKKTAVFSILILRQPGNEHMISCSDLDISWKTNPVIKLWKRNRSVKNSYTKATFYIHIYPLNLLKKKRKISDLMTTGKRVANSKIWEYALNKYNADCVHWLNAL